MQKYKNFSKFVQFIFWKFYVMKDLFGRFLLQNWDVSYFLCHRFSFCHRIRSLSVKIGTKLLFHTCFHIKISIFFWKCSFQTQYDMYRTRTILQNWSKFCQASIAKNKNTIIQSIMFCCCLFFFRSSLTRHVKE